MIPSFIVCTLILSSVILRYVFVSFTRLSTEIALLPETDRIFRFDPIKGIKIAGTLPIPKHLENRMLLVMFSRPGCKACHSEMDQFIKLHQRKPLPLLCVVETK
ncbi:MAG: hypothetical protein ACXVDB_07805, partial [Tumebacillaceae bacterium]